MAMAMTAADNLIAALSGQRPPNLLNPEVLPIPQPLSQGKG